jgi:K+-sensing histidine kinase KdpD
MTLNSAVRVAAGWVSRIPLVPSAPAAQILVGLACALVAGLAHIPGGGDDRSLLTLYLAVAAASWAGGVLGGLAAALACEIIAIYVLLVPTGSLDLAEDFSLVEFILGSLVIAGLGGHLHAALRSAEDARRRTAFLADASAILTSTLDPLPMVRALGRTVTPAFADWCAIDLLDERGEFAQAVVVGPDAAKARQAEDERRTTPLRRDDRTGVPAVVRSMQPEAGGTAGGGPNGGIVHQVPAIAAALGARAWVSVPLVTRGRALGALTLLMSESNRTFAPEDVQTAVDLGVRTGVALDHARLFRSVKARGDELDAVIGALSDAVLVADEDGTIRSFNPAAQQILGRIPVRLDDLLAELAPHPTRAGTMRTPTSHRYVVPLFLDVDGGRQRLAILRDVTEVLEGDAARDAFVGMLSHEIRTPITTIYGAARILARPLPEQTRRSLIDDLVAETDRLYRLVEDLLVLSRFERGRLEILPEPLLVHRLLARVIELERSRWPTIHLALEAEADVPPANADPTYVEQVVRNLISNAGKYAGPEASVTVRVRADGELVAVEVEDDGPGIAGDDLERVFGLYERLVSTAPTPGAGIGLFVCRRLVDAMGGTIGVVRGSAGGACFRFTLPAASGDDGHESEDEAA